MKTPEEMAEEYAEIVWDQSELAPEDRGIERHVAIGRHSTKIGFLAGYKAAQQWISVKDRLPKEGALVLLTDKDDSYNRISIGHRMFSEFDGHRWYVPGKVLLPEPFYTHWLELPAPPKEEK